MSSMMEPRRVTPGWGRRWLAEAGKLMARSPILYCGLIALQVLTDYGMTYLIGIPGGSRVVLAGAIVFMPLMVFASCWVARAADLGVQSAVDEVRTGGQFSWRLAEAVVKAGVFMGVYVLIFSGLQKFLRADFYYYQARPGIPSLLSAWLFFTACFAVFKGPLWSLHRLRWGEAEELAAAGQFRQPASFRFTMLVMPALLVTGMALPTLSADLLVAPFITAALLCAWLTFAYVGYREVYERRQDNLPARSVAATPAAVVSR